MKKIMFFLLMVSMIMLIACGGGSSSSDSESTVTPTIHTIYGKAEKGPLQKGAIIQAAQWSVATEYTGSIFVSATTDNQGAYTLAGSTLSGILDVSADGFFINENTGTVSDSRIVLSGLIDSSVQSEGNINIVTHIIKLRVMALMRSGKTFSEANNQAITELYATMNWTPENPLNTSISQNEKLLFLSAALCKDKTVDQVSNLLTTLTSDMEDGTIDISVLDDSFSAVNCAEVEAVITAMYGASPDIDTIQSDLLTYRNIAGTAPIIRIVDPVPSADFYYFTDSKQLSRFASGELSIVQMHVTITQEGESDISQNFNCIDFFKIGNIIYFSANYDGTVRYYSQENNVVSEIAELPTKPDIERVVFNDGHFSASIVTFEEYTLSGIKNITISTGVRQYFMVHGYHYGETTSAGIGLFFSVKDDSGIVPTGTPGLYFWQENRTSPSKIKDPGRIWK